MPRPPRDLTSPADAPRCARGPSDATNAFDDDSSTPPSRLTAGQAVGWAFDVPTPVDHYTVTPRSAGRASWTVETLDASDTWFVVDERTATFRWDRQTRIFTLPVPTTTSGIRLRTLDDIEVSQVEFFRLSTEGDGARGGT